MPYDATASSVSIRRVRPDDGPAIMRFYDGLTAESRRRRFLGFGRVSATAAAGFCGPDHEHSEGFVAVTLGGPADGSIVGHLCLEPAGAHGAEEVALAVADERQGQGIGRRLFEAAIGWSLARGVPSLAASAFSDNSGVLRLLSSAPGGARIRSAGGGVVEIGMPLPVSEKTVSSSGLACSSPRRRRPARAAAGSASRGSS